MSTTSISPKNPLKRVNTLNTDSQTVNWLDGYQVTKEFNTHHAKFVESSIVYRVRKCQRRVPKVLKKDLLRNKQIYQQENSKKSAQFSLASLLKG